MAYLANESDPGKYYIKILNTSAEYAAVELFKGHPEGLLKFAFVCCVIFIMIGIPGNIITVVALANYRRVRNATAFFIINLSISDLLFCCFTPSLAASTFWNRSWIHGIFLCHLFPPVRYLLTSTSIFTILAITINRYIIIFHPRLYCKLYQKRSLAIQMALIWILPFIALIPTMLGKWGHFDLDQENGSCSIVPGDKNVTSIQIFFSAIYVLPFIPMIYCYARIFFIVKKATKKSQKSKTKRKIPNSNTEMSTTQETSITVRATALYNDHNEIERDIPLRREMAGGIPLRDLNNLNQDPSSTYTVETTDGTSDTSSSSSDEESPEVSEQPTNRRSIVNRSRAVLKITLPTRKDKRLGTMIFAIMISFCLCHFPVVLTRVLGWITPDPVVNISAHILLYLSSCINPVIYVVMSNEYRKAYKNLFKRRKTSKLLIIYSDQPT